MAEWKMGPAKELVAELRMPGNVYGQSGKLGGLQLRLRKTDIIADIRKLPAHHQCVWRIAGDPAVTARYTRDRRHVIIFLGQ